MSVNKVNKTTGDLSLLAGWGANTSLITESSALSNIGTAANATQHDVNVAVNAMIPSDASASNKLVTENNTGVSKFIGSTLQSPGWYKVCEIGRENEGCALEVNLCSFFNETEGCSHIIKLAYGYNSCNMLELAKDAFYVFSAIRFVHINNNTNNILLVYYSLNKSNDCYASLNSSISEFTTFNFVPVDASQYSKYIEFSLGNNGAYINGKKLATVN